MLPKKICFVDVETTGASFNYGRIIEIGVIRIEDGRIVQTFNSLINPHCSLPPEIELLTGISSAQLENSPSFYNIKNDLLAIFEDSVLAAHNARFDYAFLKTEFKRLEISFNAKLLCTVKLSRDLYPEYRHHNLDAIIERFNFSCQSRHRAFDDAKVLWDFYQLIQKKFPGDKLLESFKKVTKRPSLPTNISEKQLDALPERSGVYIFYGKDGMPLYVGKSINIRERVLSHFSSDTESQKEMSIVQQIESIETITTNSELGALLKESELIKSMQPLYNRALRYKKKIWVLKKREAQTISSDYHQVDLIESGSIDPEETESILAVFKNKRNAKEFLVNIVKDYQLCEKLLGLEKVNGGCFGYRLGRCKGGCLKKETPIKYNLRFEEAFFSSKIKRWPFAGPIIISDGVEEKDHFMIDKWCFIGRVSDEQDFENINFQEINFDMDTYKILKRHLLTGDNFKNIREFTNTEQV